MADNNQLTDNSDGTVPDQQNVSTLITTITIPLPPPTPSTPSTITTTTTNTTVITAVSTGIAPGTPTIFKRSISTPTQQYAQFQPPMYTNPYHQPYNQTQPNPLHVNPPN